MTVSTDGILVFGFDVGDEWPIPQTATVTAGEDDPEDDHEPLDELCARDAGLVRPKHENYGGTDWSKFREAQRAAEAACPVDIVSHCSGEYPMYIVAVRGTEITANRGYPKTISPDELRVAPQKIEAAKAWCEAHGIEWQRPSWLLCSMWT